jgi:hypothetical protein
MRAALAVVVFSLLAFAQSELSDQFARSGLLAVKSIAADERVPSRASDGRWLADRRVSESIDQADADARTESELELVKRIRTFHKMKLVLNLKRGAIVNRLRLTAMPYEKRQAFITEQLKDDLQRLQDCNNELETQLRARNINVGATVCVLPAKQ